ncbi:MAG: dTDP-4-dehydrorhamnose 3,5-epimerase family protein [Patescibacteria group bacterium]|jgi:dTDP-4-dehydrorhamnose 3,5-epimerase
MKKIILTKQDYQPKPKIDGVKLVDLKVLQDDGGWFLELGRFQKHVLEHFPEFDLKQINLSEMDPSVIKAWHIHHQQDDIWFVPPSQRLLVALHDIKNHVTMRFVLGGGKAQLLFIPRGIAHGATNLWKKPAMIIYLVSQHFSADPKLSDEYRLPWDQFGVDIWQQTKG